MTFVNARQYKNKQRNVRSTGKLKRKIHSLIASSAFSGSTERCGDSCMWAMLDDDILAVALSDGMGKGNLAARESSRAVDAVIALLKAGMDPEMALQILNLLWSIDNRKELFPTMDLALLDLSSYELKIYKIGAAPTAIMRAPRCRPGRQNIDGIKRRNHSNSASDIIALEPPEKIEILTAPAMPLGVSEQNEISCISTLVMPGDRIIMLTDGVSDSRRGDSQLTWLEHLLTSIKSRNLQIVCDLIIRESALNYGDNEKDDMTVVVIRV